MNESLRLVCLADTLPCGWQVGDAGICGRPAKVAQARRYGDRRHGQEWLLLPLCRRHMLEYLRPLGPVAGVP